MYVLRRYLIADLIFTAVSYAAFAAYAPSLSGLAQSVRSGVEIYALDSSLLGPVVHRMIIVSGR